MDVIKVTEQWEARGVTLNEQGIAVGKRRWVVVTDLPIDTLTPGVAGGEAKIVAAPEVNLYDQHPHYPVMFARTADIKPHEGPTSWLVEIGYSSAPLAAQTGEAGPVAQNPLSPTLPDPAGNNSAPAQNRLPEFRFSKRDNKVAGEEDRDGDPFVNTVGDKIEGIELDEPLLQIDIKYFSVALTAGHIQDVWNTINSATWKGWGAKKLRVENFDYRSVYDTIAPGVIGLLHEANVTLLYNRKGWRLKVLNAGKRHKVYATGGAVTVQAIVGDDGHPVSDPVPLNANGSKWTSGAFHYLYFDVYEEFNFANLLT